MLRVNQVKLPAGHSGADIKAQAAGMLRIPAGDIRQMRIVRQSIDARKKPEIFYIYALDLEVKEESRILRRFQGKENLVCKSQQQIYRFPEPGSRVGRLPIVIVGTGPAGLFCGYFLAVHGYRPILLERGKCVEERQRDVKAFWENGRLDSSSNVQFGEGGAGTFSDGKLNTLVKDKDGRNRVVLETFVKFGAKESICYEAKPHIGTDVLCRVVKGMREEIVRLGGEVRFESQVKDLCIRDGRVTGVEIEGGGHLDCGRLVLAIGHSARDTFSMLHDRGVPMEAKSFAVGLRVEHPQSMINESQYGMEEPGELGAAPYKVTAKAGNGRGVYSFCMCPGGYVVNASSEEGRTAVNGMSYSGRDGRNANSAVIVTVTPEDFGSEHPLAGIGFQRWLEEKAYAIGGGKIPVQRYGEFRERVNGDGQQFPAGSTGILSPKDEGRSGRQESGEFSEITPQCKGQYVWADVSRILPKECNEAIVEGMEAFGRQIAGFNRPDACLSGVESRTSSPVRIRRGDDLQSEIRGLYPCGEGAGYAGGIVSAAMDGIRVAEAIAREYAP
ncbi:MAG: FAD-dependent oxidoreductase [Lachnospiraceae bacterium]|uniref:NAD(P)/FAD-dependent oxidoreductase n=1 Tax=uncultured Acetatifactor sp. TaxID=1671927 RepID=UPI002633B610|nr:FAD-dependent oxidoreductase [uncultured Acetatifactor sp.]MCI8788757.1 FAD-dependent oxidoreductase [Lachnospiraceae bacterium]